MTEDRKRKRADELTARYMMYQNASREERMFIALQEMRSGLVSAREASKYLNVCRNTLMSYHRKVLAKDSPLTLDDVKIVKGRKGIRLTEESKALLKNCVDVMVSIQSTPTIERVGTIIVELWRQQSGETIPVPCEKSIRKIAKECGVTCNLLKASGASQSTSSSTALSPTDTTAAEVIQSLTQSSTMISFYGLFESSTPQTTSHSPSSSPDSPATPSDLTEVPSSWETYSTRRNGAHYTHSVCSG